MPDNPERKLTLAEQAQTKWYWFTNSHKISDILAAFFFGMLVGLWVS